MLEVVIVVAIIGVLTSTGYIIAQGVVPQYRTRGAALDFATRVGQCRTLATSSGRECRVLMVAYDTSLVSMDENTGTYLVQVAIPGGGWDTMPIDTITDSVDDNQTVGTYDLPTGNYKLAHVAIDNWGTIGGPGIDNDNAIVFDSRGFVANPAGDFTNGSITITFVNKVSESRGNPDQWAVHILRTGLTKLDSTRRSADDNMALAGTAAGTSYDAAGPYGSP